MNRLRLFGLDYCWCVPMKLEVAYSKHTSRKPSLAHVEALEDERVSFWVMPKIRLMKYKLSGSYCNLQILYTREKRNGHICNNNKHRTFCPRTCLRLLQCRDTVNSGAW